MRRFSMAWASRACELHQHQPNSPIILTTFLWDPLSSRFSPPSHHRLPALPVDAELLVAGVIHNFLHGESQLHAVLRKGSTLLIGCFDADTFNFELLVEVELPDHEQQTNSHWAAEGCWLVDGPVFMAQIGGKFVVVQSSACKRSHCLDTCVDANQCDDGGWHAYMLNLEEIGDTSRGVRTLYCGDLGALECSTLLLGLQLSSRVDFEAAPSCRLRAGWNFVRIPAGQFSSKINKDTCIWQPVPLENALRVCNDLFPSDVCLDHISCIGVIPRDPVTMVSCLTSIAHDEAEERENLSYDVVVGYWNGKIVKYRLGAVVAHIDIEDAPISLQFAIVAEGQGIVLCILNGEGSTVVALCAETLLLLKAWPEFQDVVVGDFQMLGHDQLLLLSMPSKSEALSTASVDDYLIPQQLSDLKTCYFSSVPQPSVPDLSVQQVLSSLKNPHNPEAPRTFLNEKGNPPIQQRNQANSQNPEADQEKSNPSLSLLHHLDEPESSSPNYSPNYSASSKSPVPVDPRSKAISKNKAGKHKSQNARRRQRFLK